MSTKNSPQVIWGSWSTLLNGLIMVSKNLKAGPGQVAQLVRALSPYAKVAGSIPSQGT